MIERERERDREREMWCSKFEEKQIDLHMSICNR
jgi:hypothetical protein